jgi:hypothetical protein
LADDDLPNILAVALTYELPFGNGKRFVNKGGIVNGLIGGWQATSIFRAESGQPFFFRSSSFCNVPPQFAAGCIPGILPGSNPFAQDPSHFDPGKGRLFNPASFEPASSFNFYLGQGSRVSNLRGFGYHNQDFGLSKETRITEKMSIQIRFEAFNLWNWHIFTTSNFAGSNVVNTDVSSPNFGIWGGGVTAPRNFQLGAKIMF